MKERFYHIPGTQLRETRLQKSITIARLASGLAVSKAFLSAVEKGKRPVPKQWLPLLVSILGVKEEELKVHPQFQTPPWLGEGRVPNGFWDEEKNRKWFFEWFANELKLECVTNLLYLQNKEARKIIAQYGGGGMFQGYYRFSLLNAISLLFPDVAEKLKSYQNRQVPRGSSKDKVLVRFFLENLLKKYGYEKITDFYNITSKMIVNNGGYSISEAHKSSPYNIAKFAFPEYEWLPWAFRQVSSGFWNHIKNVRNYLEWLSNHLGYKDREDFYRITRKDFKDNYGSGLLSLSDNSPSSIIIGVFPEEGWKSWLFNKTPKNYWNDISHRLAYLKWFEAKLDIKSPEDWYCVRNMDFVSNNGSSLVSYYYSHQKSPVGSAAQELYPELQWNLCDFGAPKKIQRKLYDALCRIFPKREIEWEYKKFENLKFDKSGQKIGVDIFIPDLNLAFEYQGRQHYEVIEHRGGVEGLADNQKRDQEKRKKLTDSGIRLVEIDYQWDGRRDSLEAKLLGLEELHAHDTSIEMNNPSSTEIRNFTASWEMRFAQLEEFIKTHGHCDVLNKFDSCPELAKWLRAQFRAKHQGLLDVKRIKRLEQLGIIWVDVGVHLSGEEQFENLKKYKEKHGHCNVSQYCKEFPGLGRWVLKQRVYYNKNQLEQVKIDQLESIGFCWEPRDPKWNQRVAELKSFKLKYGHCNVPAQWEENINLGTWVFNLRRAQKLQREGILNPDRVDELNTIGFVWDKFEIVWLDFYKQFKEFKRVNGHCRVPKAKKDPSELRRWLDRQRQAFKKGKLSKERQEMLSAVGERWL